MCVGGETKAMYDTVRQDTGVGFGLSGADTCKGSPQALQAA